MRPLRVLNVAEKPSVAREVSAILSGGNRRSERGKSQFNPNWTFSYEINGETPQRFLTRPNSVPKRFQHLPTSSDVSRMFQ